MTNGEAVRELRAVLQNHMQQLKDVDRMRLKVDEKATLKANHERKITALKLAIEELQRSPDQPQ